jgi:predicted metal-binding membrane protein
MSEVQVQPYLEGVLKRDRAIVAAGLGLVTALAWGWTILGFGHTAPGTHALDGMGGAGSMMLSTSAWTPGHAAMILLMWWIMMVAMMLPSAAPLALLAIALYRREAAGHPPALLAAFLTAGYLGIWGGFSMGATLAQWGLETSDLLHTSTLTVRQGIAGGILLGAGAYQFTSLKQSCLTRCRSPVDYLTSHWRPGAIGSIRMGAGHGTYCLGCCWFLMALLFVGGIMNPFWIGAIALYVFLEKFSPHGQRLRRASGLMLAASGGVMLVLAL